MWWLALVVAAVPAEQWADEAPVKEQPAVVVDSPRFGPVAGIHIGASLGNEAPELGGRLGARFRLAPNFGLSVFADAQASRTRVVRQCFGRWWHCASEPYTSTLLTVVA